MKKFLYWSQVVLFMVLIFYLSSQPSINTNLDQNNDFLLKKFAHFCEYFILSFLICRALLNTTKISLKKSLLFAFLASVVYAISDEYHQSFVPGREPRIRDIIIDSFGALTASLYLGYRNRILQDRH